MQHRFRSLPAQPVLSFAVIFLLLHSFLRPVLSEHAQILSPVDEYYCEAIILLFNP